MLTPQLDFWGEQHDLAPEHGSVLGQRFGMPPFSVLDARQGVWQARKRAWLALGIQSELGRGDNALGLSAECESYRNGAGDYSKSGAVQGTGAGLTAGLLARREAEKAARVPQGLNGLNHAALGQRSYSADRAWDGQPARAEDFGTGGVGQGGLCERNAPRNGKAPRAIPGGGTELPGAVSARTAAGYRTDQEDPEAQNNSGTSIFDPVLCELAYRWFSPPNGLVLDPFAGGSVRGVVGHVLGRRYTGVDLSERQVEANREQAARIVPGNEPAWICADARDVGREAPGAYDLVFTCPPYADLEVYSADPRDLSTMSYAAFCGAYRQIIAASADLLLPDRFACIVVGDVRDKAGYYRNLIGETVEAFERAGLRLYNEAVLVTAVGSLPIRVGKQFEAGRKLGKTHQNVLVFVKGDPRKAAAACGPAGTFEATA